MNSVFFNIFHDTIYIITHYLAFVHGECTGILEGFPRKYLSSWYFTVHLPLRQKKGINKSEKHEFNSRRQMDLVDFQCQPYIEFKLIKEKQDHLSKFLVIKACISENARKSLQSSGRHWKSPILKLGPYKAQVLSKGIIIQPGRELKFIKQNQDCLTKLVVITARIS